MSKKKHPPRVKHYSDLKQRAKAFCTNLMYAIYKDQKFILSKREKGSAIVVGNPCRIIREITEDDRDYYFKDRKFDVDDYK